MIRKSGYMLLVGGFIALVFMTIQVSTVTYTSWVWHTKNLPAGVVNRETASSAMREISLETNGLVRRTLWPAVLMLVGGLMVGMRNPIRAQQRQAG
jgi:hypothetical protein